MYKYEQLIEKIRGYLDSGKVFTEKELCETYSVSRVTVRRALKELQGENPLCRRQKKGTFFGQETNRKRIAVLIILEENTDYLLIDGVESQAEKYMYTISVFFSFNDAQIEREQLEKILEENYDGIIMFSVNSHHNFDLLMKMKAKGMAMCFIDNPQKGVVAPVVVAANRCGEADLVNQYIAHGHTALGFYGVFPNMSEVEIERFNGFCQALVEHGIEPNRRFIYNFDHLGYEDDDMNRYIDEISSGETLPTVIFAVHDVFAANLYCELQKRNLPILVAGFDNLKISKTLDFSTVEQHFFKQGVAAVNYIYKQLSGQHIKNMKQFIATKTIIRGKI